jgi:hypothetical protein
MLTTVSSSGYSVMLRNINTKNASAKHVASFNTPEGGRSRFSQNVNNTFIA